MNGCIGCFRILQPDADAQPYVTPDRLERGLVIVLCGVEGRSEFNEGICRGLCDGGVNHSVYLYDWTIGVPMMNLRTDSHNRAEAAKIAQYVRNYQANYPGRPVYLVGQSSGAVMAIWTAEAMQGHQVDGVVLLATTISPDYDLTPALRASRRGIVSFHSQRDSLFLGAGTFITGTMDGRHSSSAGRLGFHTPEGGEAEYRKLYQVPWNPDMGKYGNTGTHISSGDPRFVARYVAPLLETSSWSESTVQTVLNDGETAQPHGRQRGSR
jgi:pimeloyl-ACP methyl ester carboxylesterase